MNEKEWKEKTRLTKRNKMIISIYFFMSIFEILAAIFEKDFTLILCALLWFDIAIIEYCNYKTLKGKELIIDVQDKVIENQECIINALLKETAIEIDINKIKIPKHFSKPNEKKLKEKFKYYKKHHKFESTIIIDTDYNLIDGYTSYLIAKNYNKTSVIAKLKRKEDKENVSIAD